jgi:hypothetical protein
LAKTHVGVRIPDRPSSRKLGSCAKSPACALPPFIA